jgi:flagellar biosynthesis protein FliP
VVLRFFLEHFVMPPTAHPLYHETIDHYSEEEHNNTDHTQGTALQNSRCVAETAALF